MHICKLKNKYTNKLAGIFLFIFLITCARPAVTIAEDGTIYVNKAAQVSKVAVIRSQIEIIDQSTLEKMQKEEAEELIPQGAPVIPAAVVVPPVPVFTMPTVNNLTEGTKSVWGYKVAGTDQWNELIYKVSKEEGIDPIFMKCLMAAESSGNQFSHNTRNSNGTQDYGLMQVNTSWGSFFDYNRMLSDPEYAIRSGAQVVKCKITTCTKLGVEPTVYELFWRYNGKSPKGKIYADKAIKLYGELSGKSGQGSVIFTNSPEKNA